MADAFLRAPKACYKVNQLVLVNLEIMDKYLETFRIVEDCIDETIILKRVLTTERLALQ